MQVKTKGKYIHDCDACVWCGDFTYKGDHYDLYYCAQGKETHPALASLIARWSDDGPDYASSHPPEAFVEGYVVKEWEQRVIDRARELGVYLEPKRRE